MAIKGKMARVLISSPIQARSQCELISVNVVPSVRLNNIIPSMIGLISKGGSLTYIFGVWAQKLNLAYFTRKWCSGSTRGFDLLRRGSNPLFLLVYYLTFLYNSIYESSLKIICYTLVRERN